LHDKIKLCNLLQRSVVTFKTIIVKNNILAIFFLTVTFYSCSKETTQDKNGCIERHIVPVNGHSVNSADIPEINNLFLHNGIDNSKYRYYQYLHDATQTYFPPFDIFDEKVVKVEEYTNGLPVFTAQLVFVFKNDTFNYKGGYPTKGTTLNTTPSLAPEQLRKLFIGHIEEFDHKGDFYKDSCFKAEFGYFNLNVWTNYSTENLVKAWRVTLKNSIYPSEYPMTYYQDDAGKLIYYDNGIRTFH